MIPNSSRDNKQQLLQDLEQLHSDLAQQVPLDIIPVLLEAVLDEEEDKAPDLDSQMSAVDGLLDDDIVMSDDMDIVSDELVEQLDIDSLEAATEQLLEHKSSANPVSRAPTKLPLAQQLDLGYELGESLVVAGAAATAEPRPITKPDAGAVLAAAAPKPIPNALDQPRPTRSPSVPTIAPELESILAALQPVNTPGQEENPFLPAHLREKLRHSKAILMEEIQRSNDSVNASSALLKAYAGDNLKTRDRGNNPQPTAEPNVHQQIIEALVAQYLPIIELELRKRLADSLATTPAVK